VPVRELNGKDCKTYLLTAEGGGDALLVDPLLERAEAYLDLLRAEGLRLAGVLDTHTHADHLSAGAALRDRLDIPYLMHADARQTCVTRRLQNGEAVSLDRTELRAYYTPGHTADSVSLAFEGGFLSGDFLFIGSLGAGRLDMPGGDPAAHYESLRRLDALPDSTALLPGHDYQGRTSSTLGEERRLNPVLRPRAREEYLRWWSERRPAPADWMRDVARANIDCTRDLGAARIPQVQAACACAPLPGHAEDDFPQLASLDLARMLASVAPRPFLLDVRTPEEFVGELGRIAGSVLIPIDELPSRLAEVPAGQVVSICRSGKRASKAAGLLRAAGFGEVWVLTGGMLAWNEAKLPVE
jgi:sulfur dioxygenase